MSEERFRLFLGTMCATALFTFITLYFIRAGHGMFHAISRGYSINDKLAWVLMEAPVFIVIFQLWGRSKVDFSVSVYLFFLLFQLHYFQRSFVFPFLLKGKNRMPVTIMAMGIVFNVLSGIMQAGGLFCFAPEGLYADGWAYLLKPHVLLEILLFFTDMFINLHSDHVMRHLRRSGGTKHYLPAKGLYRYATSTNYFSESVKWTGFTTLTASPAVQVFVWWAFANLVPRSDAIYRHCRAKFGDEAVGERKRIIPYVYWIIETS